MKNWHDAPPAFNKDAVVNHKELSRQVSAEMERMETEHPCKSRDERKQRYWNVYNHLRKNFKTYREMQGDK